jgi:phytoene dehydrogenase-like protein
MNGQYDFLVIGDDEASLAAAAAAAKAGALVAVQRPFERKKRSPAASAAVPNFVWRRLDLQDYDLTLEPVSARVTLLKEGGPVATYQGARQTAEALEAAGGHDYTVWRDFLDEIAALGEDQYLTRALYDGETPAGREFAALLADPQLLSKAARLFGPCADLLDDYFADPKLKLHVAAHALSLAGAGPRETGTASCLSEYATEDAWRVRTPKDGPSLRIVLERVCHDAGVAFTPEKVVEIAPASGKTAAVALANDDKLRVSHIFFATPEAAAAAGAVNCRNGFGYAGHAVFSMRFRLADGIEPPGGDRKALYQIVDGAEDVQKARDAAVEGRLYDKMPVEFEFAPNGELIARSSYLPAAFYEDGEWRGWTGQDRQAAAAIMRERLASRMPGFANYIRRSEAEVSAPPAGPSPFAGCDRVVIQPRRHDAIGAAVKLIDRVMAGDE